MELNDAMTYYEQSLDTLMGSIGAGSNNKIKKNADQATSPVKIDEQKSIAAMTQKENVISNVNRVPRALKSEHITIMQRSPEEKKEIQQE